jgi:hypothetical protein
MSAFVILAREGRSGWRSQPGSVEVDFKLHYGQTGGSSSLVEHPS